LGMGEWEDWCAYKVWMKDGNGKRGIGGNNNEMLNEGDRMEGNEEKKGKVIKAKRELEK
jgi:hypothetical protein